jgi:outer membrane protein OmpA-like peptidoglycan-associated protein
MGCARSFTLAGLLAATLAASAAPAHAQAPAAENQGFALNRYDIAEVGSDWFTGDSLDLRGAVRPGVRLGLDWAHKPLLRYDEDGDEIEAVIEDQVHVHAGVALMLAHRLRLALNLPVLLTQGGQQTRANGTTFGTLENSAALGDLRIAADLRLVGEYGDPASLAIGVQLHTPTGNREAFSGDGAVRLTPRLMLAGDLAAFAYSLRFGFGYRAQEDGFGPVALGSEVSFVATAGLRAVDGRLLIGPELWGATVVSEDDAAFETPTTPVELLLGIHYRVGGFSIGAGAGPGLSRGVGAPAVRVAFNVAYVPDASDRDGDGILDGDDACPDLAGPENKDPKLHGCPDRDRDGIIDPEDACPDVPGVRSDDPAKNGCPPEYDRDGDGILDKVDACPDVPGVANEDPKKHGCPPDRDGDGIIDPEDACPDVPGVPHDDPKKNGCPPDRDGDGILDKDDACPDVPGPANEDPELHGCPIARIEEDQIKITQRIEFEFDSAKLVPSSTPVLEAVLEILKEHEEIVDVLVEGHTDNVGKPAYNKKLSDKRAASVVKWLVEHGVAPERMRSAGVGLERPIASNDDEVGRQKNRRVEFHIKQDETKKEAEETDEDAAEPSEPTPKKSSEKGEKDEKDEEADDGLGDDPADW